MLTVSSAALALAILLLALKATNRLTLRLRLHAGMRLSAQPQMDCPHLGLAVDPFIHAEGPSEEHRCYLWMQRDRIDLAHQKGFCLSAAHRQCPWLMVRRPDARRPRREWLPGFLGGIRVGAGGLAGAGTLAQAGWASLPGLGGSLVGASRLIAGTLAAGWLRAVPLLAVMARQIWRAMRLVAGQAWRLTVWLAVRAWRSAGWLIIRGWHLAAGTAARARARRLAQIEARQRMRAAASAGTAAPATLEQPTRASVEAAPAGAFTPAEPIREPVANAPVAAQSTTPSTLEGLLAEGLKALDQDQEQLAYHLFRKATELRGADQRAWFWRAKTAETVEEVVHALERGLELDPGNVQMQAHLAWARQRLERQQRLAGPNEMPAMAPVLPELRLTVAGETRWAAAVGELARVAGGLMALALALLWMTAGLLPLLGRALAGLTPQDQLWVRTILPTLNVGALPGNGRLTVPVLNVDLIASLPFVLGFLFLFTARGVVDGDAWARSGALLAAAVGGLLFASQVATPQASHLGLALCIGLVVASIAGSRQQQPPWLPLVGAGYS